MPYLQIFHLYSRTQRNQSLHRRHSVIPQDPEGAHIDSLRQIYIDLGGSIDRRSMKSVRELGSACPVTELGISNIPCCGLQRNDPELESKRSFNPCWASIIFGQYYV
jgi:hypothetical protein